MSAYLQTASGYVVDTGGAGSYCQYCPVSDGNPVLQSLNMGTDKGRAWRSVGLMTADVVFDVLAIFLIYYVAKVPRKR